MSTRKTFLTNRLTMIALITALVLSLLGAGIHPAAASASVSSNTVAAEEVAFITIVSVEKNKSVTIQVANMRANTEYRVLMNKIGTKGVGGAVAGTAKTDRNGSFRGTFNIPSQYKDLYTIAIRIESTGVVGSYAYNWFVNSTSGSTSGSSGSGSGSGAVATSGNLTLVSLIEDVSVTIKAKNAPASTKMYIYLDWTNNQGQQRSVLAGTVISASDGTVSATAKFPNLAKDRAVLAVRLSAPGYSASVWFVNATSKSGVGGGAPASDPGGIPFISIVKVVEANEVTIELSNLPLRKEFNVLMSNSNALGVNGVKVGTVKATKKGVVTETFDIPRSLRNRDKIAIRIEAADGSGYYAFNWFHNETTP